MYNLLPQFLTLKESVIHGLGCFARESIPSQFIIGVTHVYLDHKVIRTPLGGFINHAVLSNCVLEDGYLNQDDEIINMYKCKRIMTTRLINPGEELTLTYKMYDPT